VQPAETVGTNARRTELAEVRALTEGSLEERLGMPVRFHVITPCRNAANLIEDTVESVIGQSAIRSGRAILKYFIVDGDSTDDTVACARSASEGRAHIISKPDTGMYDALATGFSEIASDDGVTCYINAGDMFSSHAFDTVIDIFARPDIDWVTGYSAYYNQKGHTISFRLPFRYRRSFFSCGIYGTRLPHVQQESTFWRTRLLSTVDYDLLRDYRLAGDAYLWRCFSEVADLYIASTFLGGFRHHGEHLSDARELYRQELLRDVMTPSLRRRLHAAVDSILWRSPDRVKKFWNPQLLRYDLEACEWR
jgi:glycosyltransferase involved in cell wall biosynthesis